MGIEKLGMFVQCSTEISEKLLQSMKGEWSAATRASTAAEKPTPLPRKVPIMEAPTPAARKTASEQLQPPAANNMVRR